MGNKTHLRKVTDYKTSFWCAGGIGRLREEFWVDDSGVAVYYNLAFLMPHLSRIDNGRVLGFDNAHGMHERHFMGEVEEVDYHGFPATSQRFYLEVAALRRRFEEKK